MKTKTSLLILYLAGIGLASSGVFAQDDPNQSSAGPGAAGEETEPIVPEAFISEPIYSDIELGIGYVTDDAYFF